MRITHERQKCIGCGACAVVCSKFFEMGEDGRSLLKGGKENAENGIFELEIDEVSCAKDAVMSCPVEIIKIVD